LNKKFRFVKIYDRNDILFLNLNCYNIRYIITKQFNDGNSILHTYSFFGKEENRINERKDKGKKGKRNKKGERN